MNGLFVHDRSTDVDILPLACVQSVDIGNDLMKIGGVNDLSLAGSSLVSVI